jgi:hypothetical protein
MRPLQQTAQMQIVGKSPAEMKKGLVLTRPYIKIAGAQEGTRVA